MKLILMTSLLLSAQASVEAAWKMKDVKTSNQSNKSPSWFVEADYLYWKTHQEDLFYGLHANASLSGLNLNPIKPHFDWSSGVRIGIGGYTHDQWDVGVKVTYIYADAQKTAPGTGNLQVSNGFPQGSFIFPTWVDQILGFANKARARWTNNFFIYDFLLGREYKLSSGLNIHPFFGVRGFSMFQHYNCKYHSGINGNDTQGNNLFYSLITQMKAKNTTFGVGPRVGVDLGYQFTKSWAALGGVSGSILYSHYKVSQSLKTFIIESGVLTPFEGVGKDSDQIGRTNLDAYLGLNWSHSYNQAKNRFQIGLLFEASYWYGLNQYMDIDVAESGDGGGDALTSLNPAKRHGDLSFMGATLQFKFDF